MLTFSLDSLAELVYILSDCLTDHVSCPVRLYCSDVSVFPDHSNYFGDYSISIMVEMLVKTIKIRLKL